MTKIQKNLFKYQDKVYAEFSAKLIPEISSESFIGVRVPDVRKIAKEIYGSSEAVDFMNELPHKYYDENMLHGMLVSQIMDYEQCLTETNKFLPYVDNWAVCDILSPAIFKKNKDKLIREIKKWAKSKEVFTCRFGIELLMSYYLDDEFKAEFLDIPAKVKSDEYYVNMMIAWFFATALAKQWNATIPYIENKVLDKWVHNKTIQKSIESRRITQEQKEYLRSLKK